AAALPGIDYLAEEVLGLPARIGRPRHLSGLSDILQDPAYATSAGLLRWALKEQAIMFRSTPSPVAPLGGLFKKVAHLMRVVLPQ
ncbi:MAG TPA: hypothetical protein VFH77_08745, partial [Streptomyces sp.]|nr:hypothetical protein [Streptomyces sp.]